METGSIRQPEWVAESAKITERNQEAMLTALAGLVVLDADNPLALCKRLITGQAPHIEARISASAWTT